MGFAAFMSSVAGRGARMVAGLLLIMVGVTSGSWLLAVIGVVPVAAAALDVCLFAPLFGAPLKGADVRAKIK